MFLVRPLFRHPVMTHQSVPFTPIPELASGEGRVFRAFGGVLRPVDFATSRSLFVSSARFQG